jgi:hypothetical protein
MFKEHRETSWVTVRCNKFEAMAMRMPRDEPHVTESMNGSLSVESQISGYSFETACDPEKTPKKCSTQCWWDFPSTEKHCAKQNGAIPCFISNSDILQGKTMGPAHPTRQLSRLGTTDYERQNLNVDFELGRDIVQYLRSVEHIMIYDSSNCLQKHDISAKVRSRMIDWKIEVLTNFKCDDQTFFISVNLMDRYLKLKGNAAQTLAVSELHILGVTCMFIASKFEDIYPLKMKTMHEKIAYEKLQINDIKELELDNITPSNSNRHNTNTTTKTGTSSKAWSKHQIIPDVQDSSPTFLFLISLLESYFDLEILASRLNYYPNKSSWNWSQCGC